MTLISYNKDIPDGPHNPSNDQPLMKTNTNSIFDIINVDHYTFNDNKSGWHKQVNMFNEASPTLNGNIVLYSAAAPFSGPNVLWVKNSSLDQPLFTIASGSLNGYTSAYGQILFQWGTVASIVPNVFTSVSFPTNFKSNCFNVQATLIPDTHTTNSQTISIKDFTTSQFRYNYSGGSAYTGFRWFAVGV